MSETRAGRVVIVTGGAQGIGLVTSLHLRTLGDRVIAADRDAEACAELEDAHGGPDLLAQPVDIADEAAVISLVHTVLARFGRLDALVNNAGFGVWKPVTELTLSEWNRVLATNLTGAFLCAKHAAPHLAASGGAIVNIASTRALMSEPDGEAYAASKGGLLALTHALAVSLGPAVRVNAISPGWVEVGDWQKASARRAPEHRWEDEAQHPVGRVGRPADIAATVDFLLSERAGFITGQNIVVDGGMTRKMIYHEASE